MDGAVGIQQAICQCIRSTERGPISREGVQIFLQSQQGESAGPRTLELHSYGNGQLKQTSRSSPQSRILGSAKNGPESPQGSPVAVFRAFGLLPLAFVAQAISKPPAFRVESQPQKSQIARGEVQGAGGSAAAKLLEEDCDDERPSIVIRGVSFRIVRDHKDRVLHDSGIVGHSMQVVQSNGGKP